MHYAGLIVYDAFSLCMDYMEKSIQVGEINCSAQFSYYVDIATNTAFCKNEAIGQSVEYYWFFGDGSFATDKNPSHKFKQPGYYTIGLSTFDATNWCMDYYENVVLIGEEGIDCEAMFIYTAYSDRTEINFTDRSKGNIKSYLWDFGDGNTSTQTNPAHTYSRSGYYNVCLNVTNTNNIPNITCKSVRVGSDEKTNCKAKFIYSINKATYTVSFNSNSTGNITEYNWNFGTQSDQTKVKNPVVTYTNNDYYLVSLNIKTAEGCQSKAYELININMPDTLMVKFGYDPQPYSKKAGGYPLDFVGAGLGDNARLRWDFGDGQENTTSNTPTNTYKEAGTYKVCLKYEDPVTGAEAEHCEDVTTEQLCQSDKLTPDIRCKDYTLELDQNGNGTLKIENINNNSADQCGPVSLSLSKTTFNINDAGKEIIVKLYGTDPSNNTDSCQAKVTVTTQSAIAKTVGITGFWAYPNPAGNILNIEYQLLTANETELSICDLTGKRIVYIQPQNLAPGPQKLRVDLTNFAPGSYIVNLNTLSGISKKQLIIKK